MAKMRVYELARELDLESKDVLARAVELGLEVKTASSGLDPDAADLVRLSYQEEAAVADEDTSAVEPDVAEEVEAEPEDAKPKPAEQAEAPETLELIEVPRGITAGDLATEMGKPVSAVVRALIELGEMASASQAVPEGALDQLAEKFGYLVTTTDPVVVEEVAEVVSLRPELHEEDKPEDLVPRPPVVTVMGHVDHGKTQLLDTIRKTRVVAGEAGGITQHIGAYQLERNGGSITFIDTPGHEAFTSLRARGANVTDIVILVVAADDGVMPQTAEAINHARAASVPIIVAINKIDLPDADPQQVRVQLTEHDILVEELGGEIVTAEVSALNGDGIDHLLELIDITAELEDLKANPEASAEGVVIESNIDKGRGAVATVIVQRGTLRVGDPLAAGAASGKVRAMLDENGAQVKEAGPSRPVLVMGWDSLPDAGDRCYVTIDDKTARSRADARHAELRAENLVVPTSQERMASLLEGLRTADDAELRLVVKADAHGSLEAIKDKVAEISREGGRITLVHAAVGGINESDVVLADASGAIVIGFNVRPDGKTRKLAEAQQVEMRTYRVIYELLDEVEQLLVGQLAPERVEEILGVAEVRATFRAPRLGLVAGCYVSEGEMTRGAKVRLVRDGVVVYDGSIASLRRFKDDVRSVTSGFECGIGLTNFRDIKDGDVIESYQVREVARV